MIIFSTWVKTTGTVLNQIVYRLARDFTPQDSLCTAERAVFVDSGPLERILRPNTFSAGSSEKPLSGAVWTLKPFRTSNHVAFKAPKPAYSCGRLCIFLHGSGYTFYMSVEIFARPES